MLLCCRYGDDLDVSSNIAAVADYLEACAKAQAAEQPSPLPDNSLRHLVRYRAVLQGICLVQADDARKLLVCLLISALNVAQGCVFARQEIAALAAA